MIKKKNDDDANNKLHYAYNKSMVMKQQNVATGDPIVRPRNINMIAWFLFMCRLSYRIRYKDKLNTPKPNPCKASDRVNKLLLNSYIE